MSENISGLSSSEIVGLQKQYGPNSVEIKKKNTWFKLLASQYKNFITLFLVLATIFAFIVGDLLDGIFIFIFIFVNGVFGFVQEFRAEKTI